MAKHTQTKEAEGNPAIFNLSQKDDIMSLLEIIGFDGHTIYRPAVLAAFPKELQDRFTHEKESDTSHWKSTLTDNDGNVIDRIVCVYGLSVLEGMASDFGLEGHRRFGGRGFRAQAATKELIEHLTEKGGE